VGEAEVVDDELVEDLLEVDDVLLVELDVDEEVVEVEEVEETVLDLLEVDDVLLVELDVDEEVVEVEEVEETVLDLLCVSHYFSLEGNIRHPSGSMHFRNNESTARTNGTGTYEEVLLVEVVLLVGEVLLVELDLRTSVCI
jgi:hypothetical protein